MIRSMLEPQNILEVNIDIEPSMESLANKLRIVAQELQVLNDESDELQMYENFKKVMELNTEIV